MSILALFGFPGGHSSFDLAFPLHLVVGIAFLATLCFSWLNRRALSFRTDMITGSVARLPPQKSVSYWSTWLLTIIAFTSAILLVVCLSYLSLLLAGTVALLFTLYHIMLWRSTFRDQVSLLAVSATGEIQRNWGGSEHKWLRPVISLVPLGVLLACLVYIFPLSNQSRAHHSLDWAGLEWDSSSGLNWSELPILAANDEVWREYPAIQLPFLGWSSRTSFESLAPTIRILQPRTIYLYENRNLRSLAGLENNNSLRVLVLAWCHNLKNLDGLHGLNSLQFLSLSHCDSLVNIDGIRDLPKLRALRLANCRSLTNVDALSGLSALHVLYLDDSKSLNNVDALMKLKGLQVLDLRGCDHLPQSIRTVLAAALPNTQITFPDDFD